MTGPTKKNKILHYLAIRFAMINRHTYPNLGRRIAC